MDYQTTNKFVEVFEDMVWALTSISWELKLIRGLLENNTKSPNVWWAKKKAAVKQASVPTSWWAGESDNVKWSSEWEEHISATVKSGDVKIDADEWFDKTVWEEK